MAFDTSEKKRQGRNRVIAAVLALAVVIVAFVMFLNMNNHRIEEQNARYLQGSTEQSARRIDEWMNDSQTELALLASLYATTIDKPEEANIADIAELGSSVKFTYLTYSVPGGETFDSSGQVGDASDREYYLEGIQGQSGVCAVENSLFYNDLSVIFYTPLVIDGQVAGVLAGAYREDAMSTFLQTSFFGEQTSTYLCYPDGTVMAHSSPEGRTDIRNAQDLYFEENATSSIDKDDFARAFEEGVSVTFTYKTAHGSGMAYAVKLGHYDLVLMRTFPSSITSDMQTNANEAGLLLVVLVAASLVALAAFLLLQSLKQRRELEDESEFANEIIKSSLNLFQRFAMIDLDKDTFSYLKEDVGKMRMPNEHSYSDFRKAWTANLADPDDEVAIELDPDRIRERLTTDVPFEQIEYRTLDKETGAERWVQGSIISLTRKPNGQVSTVLMAVSDVTEMKQRELRNHIALEAALREAEQASRAKTDFLNSMSHDIRTPMNSIMGLTAIATMYLDDPERVKDCLAKITTSSRHLLGLINEVLDMAKIESGKLDLSQEDFDLSETVESLLTIMTPQINDKNLKLKVEISDIEHEHVVGDPMRLQQVFVNIMGNSVKFTPEGGTVSLAIKELPSRVRGSGRYEFTFSDTGCGMSEEFLEKVFEPFTRANDSRVTKVEGTGLGMSIVRSVVNLMDGTIDVKSKLGEGTTFVVTVYMKLREGDKHDLAPLEGLHVLVADDEETACENACSMLQSIGMEPEYVLSGEAAIERISGAHSESHDFSAVILDWKMPGKSGIETAREIRDILGDDVPIIILSAYDWSSVEQEARAVGVDAFITKPLFRSRLTRVMRGLLCDSEETVTEGIEALAQRDFSGHRILLTEDNTIAAFIAQDILEMVGVEVDHAENGRVAVDKLLASEPGHYDLVFMDIQMPVMNGYEAASAIGARPDLATLPIIALTADAFADDIARALAAGMDAHMSKPMEIDVLARVLEKWLQN